MNRVDTKKLYLGVYTKEEYKRSENLIDLKLPYERSIDGIPHWGYCMEAKKSMFDSRDSFIDFVLAHRDELNDTIQKSIDDLKSGFMD